MPVERRFRYADRARERGGRDARAGIRFQLPRQYFEDLLPAIRTLFLSHCACPVYWIR
jgi:hypothetical protein